MGKTRPYALYLDMGAGEATVDLGGLPLTQLAVNFGAGKQTIDFSAPNPQPMERVRVTAGAASLELMRLANANVAEVSVEGGAAAYVFDFGGQLRRDVAFKLTAGMSSVEIRIPSGTAAKVTTETVLGSVDMADGFMKKEGAFWNEAALRGATPTTHHWRQCRHGVDQSGDHRGNQLGRASADHGRTGDPIGDRCRSSLDAHVDSQRGCQRRHL